MKNRRCPYKHVRCWSYGENNCDGCPVGEKFTQQARKIKRLKTELAASLANELNMTDGEFDEEVKTARKKVERR